MPSSYDYRPHHYGAVYIGDDAKTNRKVSNSSRGIDSSGLPSGARDQKIFSAFFEKDDGKAWSKRTFERADQAGS